MCAIRELREQGADSHVHLTPVSSSRKLPAEEKVERSLGATPPTRLQGGAQTGF